MYRFALSIKMFYFAAAVLLFSGCKAFTKTSYIDQCKELVFDLSDGTLNGVKPTLNQAEIKEWFPCYTKFSPDGSTMDCGGALLYANHNFYFYTYLDDYIEVRSGFKGNVSDSLLGKPREQVRNILGTPVENKHSKEDPLVDFFSKEYGCIRIHYRDNLAVVIAAHYNIDCENVEWCKE